MPPDDGPVPEAHCLQQCDLCLLVCRKGTLHQDRYKHDDDQCDDEQQVLYCFHGVRNTHTVDTVFRCVKYIFFINSPDPGDLCLSCIDLLLVRVIRKPDAVIHAAGEMIEVRLCILMHTDYVPQLVHGLIGCGNQEVLLPVSEIYCKCIANLQSRLFHDLLCHSHLIRILRCCSGQIVILCHLGIDPLLIGQVIFFSIYDRLILILCFNGGFTGHSRIRDLSLHLLQELIHRLTSGALHLHGLLHVLDINVSLCTKGSKKCIAFHGYCGIYDQQHQKGTYEYGKEDGQVSSRIAPNVIDCKCKLGISLAADPASLLLMEAFSGLSASDGIHRRELAYPSGTEPGEAGNDQDD